MTRQKITNPYQRRIAASVAWQYKLEAQQLHMSLSSYISWLKTRANYRTAYDTVAANLEALSNKKIQSSAAQQDNAEQNANQQR